MMHLFTENESIISSNTGNFSVEIATAQAHCDGERQCGDTFLYRHFTDQNRTLLILSDGLGHGDTAQLMSAQATQMLFAELSHQKSTHYNTCAPLFDHLLTGINPCPNRNVGYATFTVVDIDHNSGHVDLIEYDNPQLFIFRDAIPMLLERRLIYAHPFNGRNGEVMHSDLHITPGDSLILLTDGITQSGQGVSHDFGCGRGYMQERLENIIAAESTVSAERLASFVVGEALRLDGHQAKDDLSCAVLRLKKHMAAK